MDQNQTAVQTAVAQVIMIGFCHMETQKIILKEKIKLVVFELSSNMYTYYAFGNHIYSFSYSHLCTPCLVHILY